MTAARTIKILIGVIVVANVLFWLPSTRLFCLYAMGRTSRCPLQKAVHSFDTMARRVAIQRQLDREKRLVQSDPSGFHLWDTPRGRYWIPARNDETLTDNLAEQATKVYGDGEEGVHTGDVVLDCGANVGVFTREALTDGARLVAAIEPAPENVECLRRNFADEIGKGRVIVVPKGVWDRDDILTLRVDAGNSARNSFVGSFGPAKQEVKVPLTTIDQLMTDLKLDRADFIKMDIEGAEKQALRGARNTITRFHPRMAIAMEHLADDPVRIPEVVFAEWPAYRITCGDCIDQITKARPDVLFFR
jgi:FkbM family methyltransferase